MHVAKLSLLIWRYCSTHTFQLLNVKDDAISFLYFMQPWVLSRLDIVFLFLLISSCMSPLTFFSVRQHSVIRLHFSRSLWTMVHPLGIPSLRIFSYIRIVMTSFTYESDTCTQMYQIKKQLRSHFPHFEMLMVTPLRENTVSRIGEVVGEKAVPIKYNALKWKQILSRNINFKIVSKIPLTSLKIWIHYLNQQIQRGDDNIFLSIRKNIFALLCLV